MGWVPSLAGLEPTKAPGWLAVIQPFRSAEAVEAAGVEPAAGNRRPSVPTLATRDEGAATRNLLYQLSYAPRVLPCEPAAGIEPAISRIPAGCSAVSAWLACCGPEGSCTPVLRLARAAPS